MTPPARSWIAPLTCLAVALVPDTSATAREHAPRVVSPHHPDAYSMKTFAQFSRWRDLKDDARAWEVYQYLTDMRTGLFPLGQPAFEGKDLVSEFRNVRDPVKILNVYGYGYCGILGPTMAGICQEAGFGRSRTLVLPGLHHVVAEVSYGGKWHYLDLDLRGIFRRADGSLASMDDSKRDPDLWKGPNSARFFPLDSLAGMRRDYEKTPVQPHYDYYQGGHTMDYVLRQGETFTRWWTPQGGHWLHNERYHTDPYFKKLFERAPPGPKCKHTAWSVHTHGNGRFVYKPNLTDQSSDFADGVHDSGNVASAANGLTLKEAGEGFAVFEVRSPYVIVPVVGKFETADDDRDASVVTLDATGDVAVACSVDNGLTWADVPLPERKSAATLDLTRHVAGTYGYLLRLRLKGKPAETAVRSLAITTWVQLAPAALPGLRKGKNAMEYRTGDHHGLQTRVLEIRTNGNDRVDFLKYLHEPPKDFDPERISSRARGPFVVRVQALPGSKIAWLSAGGSFQAHQGDAAPNTRNAIEYAVEEPKDYKPLYKADVPAGQGHWHYNADRELKLDAPARVVFLRYIGDPGVNHLRIYAHCSDDKPPRGSGVVITHTWKENGAAKSKQVCLDGPGAYEITTVNEPIDGSVEIAVPSR